MTKLQKCSYWFLPHVCTVFLLSHTLHCSDTFTTISELGLTWHCPSNIVTLPWNNTLCLPGYPSLLPNLENLWIFFCCLCSSIFLRMSQRWNPTVGCLSRLTSDTLYYGLKVPVYTFFLIDFWILFHCWVYHSQSIHLLKNFSLGARF